MKKTLAMLSMLIVSGCGISQFTAETSIHIDKESIDYRSNKNQEIIFDPETKKLHIRSVTPEQAMISVMEENKAMRQDLKALIDILKSAAVAAGKIP